MLPIRAPAPNVPDFTPVPRRGRSDGWTEARQRAFIAMLAATGSVTVAVDSVGLSIGGVYKLRSEPGAASFVRAWSEALDAGVAALRTVAFDRAVNGVPVTLHYKGEQTATTTRYDNRLLMSLLRNYDRVAATAPAPATANPGRANGSSTDTATIMWLAGIQQIGRHQWLQAGNAYLLKHLLKLKRFPEHLDGLIWSATYMVTRANRDLDREVKRANAGPEGMRAAAARVTHKLQPVVLTVDQQARADTALAYLRGEGPPVTILRLPIPEGAPEVNVDN